MKGGRHPCKPQCDGRVRGCGGCPARSRGTMLPVKSVLTPNPKPLSPSPSRSHLQPAGQVAGASVVVHEEEVVTTACVVLCCVVCVCVCVCMCVCVYMCVCVCHWLGCFRGTTVMYVHRQPSNTHAQSRVLSSLISKHSAQPPPPHTHLSCSRRARWRPRGAATPPRPAGVPGQPGVSGQQTQRSVVFVRFHTHDMGRGRGMVARR